MTTVSLDFDGVLHQCSKGWHNGLIYDPPVPGSKEAVDELARQGFDLVISTCRDDVAAVADWVETHYKRWIPVTNYKPIASVYIDNRAIHFDNWSQALEDTLKLLETPWEE